MSFNFLSLDYDLLGDYARKEKMKELYSKIDDYFNNSIKYGLSYREGQHNMALSVFEAIESKEHLIIEAGVGIGKSFAYLIPLIYFFEMSGKSFIISTSTIALQEQLKKDINIISNQLNIPVDVVVAKGMSNFICFNRLEEFLSKLKDDNQFIKIFTQNKQDRKDYPGIKDNVWKQINVEKCNYFKCKNHRNCEFYKRRELMKSINGIIICNHDLLIEDLSRKSNYGKELLQKVDYIVCDEAHNLENKVRSFKTNEIKIRNVKIPLRNAINILSEIGNVEYDYLKIEEIIDNLYTQINDNVLMTIEKLKKVNIEVEDCNGLELVFDEQTIKLSNMIKNILKDINDSIQIHSNKNTEEIEDDLNEYSKMFEILSSGQNGNYLFWIERRKRRNYVYCAPKNINTISYDLFFNNNHSFYRLDGKTFIFTSATLSVGKNNFKYFMQNIGADLVQNGLTLEDSYDSPYDYENNAIIYSCKDIESPKNKNKYLKELVQKIKELILITNGKALVLFTSKSDMKYVYEHIGNKIGNINIYIQNDGSSQDTVKRKFKEDINSVLFSTGIFWEGIDIKGKSLSNLIIARLPFPIVDPIMEYKKSLNKNGFAKVYIPEMLIKLKQGVGRLIRSETDKGIVCILDSRMDKYEKRIKETLPIKKIVYSIEDLKSFIKKNKIDEWVMK